MGPPTTSSEPFRQILIGLALNAWRMFSADNPSGDSRYLSFAFAWRQTDIISHEVVGSDCLSQSLDDGWILHCGAVFRMWPILSLKNDKDLCWPQTWSSVRPLKFEIVRLLECYLVHQAVAASALYVICSGTFSRLMDWINHLFPEIFSCPWIDMIVSSQARDNNLFGEFISPLFWALHFSMQMAALDGSFVPNRVDLCCAIQHGCRNLFFFFCVNTVQCSFPLHPRV